MPLIDPNPYVGNTRHDLIEKPLMAGRRLRRAQARGYGEPQPQRPRRKRKKR